MKNRLNLRSLRCGRSRWEWNDEDWQEGEWDDDAAWPEGEDPWSAGATTDGWLTDGQVRQFCTADVARTTALVNGRWSGTYDQQVHGAGAHWWEPNEWDECMGRRRQPPWKGLQEARGPSFDGESSSKQDLGKSGRSYLRKIQVWLRCARMLPDQRGPAL